VRFLAVERPDGLVVLVEFRLHPGKAAAFWPVVMANARASVRDEPGCRRFDVLTPEQGSDPDTVWLYEIYDDAAAFAAHLASPHFKIFAAASEPLIATRRVLRLDLVENVKPKGQP
jgi:quinol monooxygenase YgiN